MTRRKIADKGQNRYAAAGAPAHSATDLAPESMFAPVDKRVLGVVQDQQKEILEFLEPRCGAPFYTNHGFVLYNADSSRFLADLPPGAVDLTITSPPYNIGKEYEKPMRVADYVDWCARWMALVFRATAPGGAFWLNLGYFEVPGRGQCVPIPYLLWDRSPFFLLQEVVWNYGAGVAARKRLSPRNEKWLFYVRDRRDYTFNLDEIRDPNVKYPNQKKNGRYRCNPLGKNPSDVWAIPKVTTGRKRASRERTGHPAQFPLALVDRIVRACSHPAEVVVDPFAGSGSAGLAAAARGRLFIGVEIDRRYCELAAERYEAFLARGREAV